MHAHSSHAAMDLSQGTKPGLAEFESKEQMQDPQHKQELQHWSVQEGAWRGTEEYAIGPDASLDSREVGSLVAADSLKGNGQRASCRARGSSCREPYWAVFWHASCPGLLKERASLVSP